MYLAAGAPGRHHDRDGDARREPPGQLCEVDQLVEGTQHRPRRSDRGRLLREELATAEVQRTLGEQVDHRLERVSQGQREHERNEDSLEVIEPTSDHGEVLWRLKTARLKRPSNIWIRVGSKAK